MPVSPERKAAFLRGLRESGGSFAHACRCASPHLDEEGLSKPPAYQTWRNLLQTDIQFHSAYETVMQEVRDGIIEALHERSVRGIEVGVYGKGQRIYEPVTDKNGEIVRDANGNPKMKPATVRKYSDQLLAMRARALLGPEYQDRREVNVNVTSGTRGHWTISADDIVCLTAAQREQLMTIMERVRDHRKEHAALPAPGPTNVVDAEYAEVETDEAWDSPDEPIAF